MTMRKLLILIIGLFYLSCNSDKPLRNPGICLSFDDRTVNEWFQLREIFNDNDVKVTFFINQPDSLNKQEISKLKTLEKDGHEIGFHGNMHVLSESYINEHSYSEYLNKEINQGVETMRSLGFNCISFAYPYGAKYWFTDFLLLRKFEFLRSVAPLNDEKDLTKIEEIFYPYNNQRTFSAIGIDANSGVNSNMIDRALERAKNNKEVLFLYAHKPTTSDKNIVYSFEIDILNHLINKAKEYQIDFVTMKELTTKYNNKSNESSRN